MSLLFLLMATLAPATACGDSPPVALPSLLDLGVGSMLVLRDAAMELAGRGVALATFSLALGGCNEARRFPRADMEDCEAKRGLGNVCWARGPGDARRSRKDRLGDAVLDGVSSGIGDDEPARLSGLRRGSLDAAELGVRVDGGREVTGVLAYGLGEVRLRGLKLCPVSTLSVELFQRG